MVLSGGLTVIYWSSLSVNIGAGALGCWGGSDKRWATADALSYSFCLAISASSAFWRVRWRSFLFCIMKSIAVGSTLPAFCCKFWFILSRRVPKLYVLFKILSMITHQHLGPTFWNSCNTSCGISSRFDVGSFLAILRMSSGVKGSYFTFCGDAPIDPPAVFPLGIIFSRNRVCGDLVMDLDASMMSCRMRFSNWNRSYVWLVKSLMNF